MNNNLFKYYCTNNMENINKLVDQNNHLFLEKEKLTYEIIKS